jgi:YD repeat-containing protein
MKLLSKPAIMFAGIVLTCFASRAQDCKSWNKIKKWQGSYSLNGSGSYTYPYPLGTTTINEVSAATVDLDNVAACPGPLEWVGPDTNYSASINDTFVAQCMPSGTHSNTNVGAGGSSSSSIIIDFSKGTYTFQPVPYTNATYTSVDCNGNKTTFANTPVVFPSTNWPMSFALPNSVQPLTNNLSFQAGSQFTGGNNSGNVGWTFSFTLTPILNDNIDDPCKRSGGSSMGCQNQSLGEDVPIVGTGYFLHHESDRMPGRNGSNNVAQADAVRNGGWTLNVHHVYDPQSNTLFLGDGGQRSAWQLGASIQYNGNALVTSQDGAEVYIFDNASGRHLQTLKPMTGAVKYQFAYDVSGNLISVTDGSGNVTSIHRDGSGHATAIVSPFSQTTTLTIDGNGFLSQVNDPAGNTSKFSNTSTGLVGSRTDANGNVYNYAYDATGALTTDSDSAGGSTSLSRTDTSSGYAVTTTTALGRKSTFQVTTSGGPGEQLTNTWSNGLQATVTKTETNGGLSEISTLPDGSADNKTLGPDPRWGLQAPVALSGTITNGSLKMTTTATRTATLAVAGNPFTLTTQTDTLKINGRTYSSVFTSSNKTYVAKSPASRKTTTILDALERISSVQLGTLLPLQLTYDNQGRPNTLTQGTRKTSLSYNSSGFPASVTNPLGLQTSFAYDLDGRLLTTTLPDGRAINYTYDANGNLTSVTPPGKPAHQFTYTAVDLASTYAPPTVTGTGVTSYSYDLDRNLATITRPDSETINYAYDSAGRLSSVTTPTATNNYIYDGTTGNLSSASISGGEGLTYGYNGPLLTSSQWSGTVAGTVSRTFDNNFWVASESLNGGNTVPFTHDKDGLLTKAGALVVKYNSTGLLTSATLGNSLDTRGYNSFGELTSYAAKYKVGTVSTTLFGATYTRDANGRISAKTETIGGVKNTYAYTYDQSGRIAEVQTNGIAISSYSYDTNSNRLGVTTSSGTVNGTYDDQDRLLSYGNASYTYSANGELASQTTGSQTTSYTYDVQGNLTGVTLPGTQITYVIDARNHRVGMSVNGAPQAGFLYDEGDRIVAQLNASNR